MTKNWPQDFVDVPPARSISLARHRARVSAFFKENRPSHNMVDWIRMNNSVSRQRLHQIESHQAAVTQKTAAYLAKVYGDDPLRIQLRTGECPVELAYKLGWDLWDKFQQFLTTNLQGDKQ